MYLAATIGLLFIMGVSAMASVDVRLARTAIKSLKSQLDLSPGFILCMGSLLLVANWVGNWV